MSHQIVWSFDGVCTSAEAICTDPDCINRFRCTQPCETVYDVRREPDGTVTHAQWDDDERQIIHRHQMVKDEYCNVTEWLNADPSMIPELAETRDSFEIGRTVIEPVWQGEDGMTWKRAVS